MNATKLENIGRRLAQAKKIAPTRPHPRRTPRARTLIGRSEGARRGRPRENTERRPLPCSIFAYARPRVRRLTGIRSRRHVVSGAVRHEKPTSLRDRFPPAALVSCSSGRMRHSSSTTIGARPRWLLMPKTCGRLFAASVSSITMRTTPFSSDFRSARQSRTPRRRRSAVDWCWTSSRTYLARQRQGGHSRGVCHRKGSRRTR